MRAISLTPRVGCRMVTLSEASWNASRSEVATSAWPPRAVSASAAAARKSSASYPPPLATAKPNERDELGEKGKLLEELGVELASRLVRVERLVPVGRHLEGVPGDENGARFLRLPQADEHVGEADERAGRAAVGAADRLRQRVVRAVGERVAVDDEQGSHPRAQLLLQICDPLHQPLRRDLRRRPVVMLVQVVERHRLTVGDAKWPEPGEPVGSHNCGGNERDAGDDRDPGGTGVCMRSVLLA